MSNLWTIPQACVWIATRDEALVNRLSAEATLVEAGLYIFDGCLTGEQHRAYDACGRRIAKKADDFSAHALAYNRRALAVEKRAARAIIKKIDPALLQGLCRQSSVWRAGGDLLERLKAGTLTATGRQDRQGDTQQIPVDKWPGLKLYDNDAGHGSYAGSHDIFDASATKWDRIVVRAADLKKAWPVGAKPKVSGAEKDRLIKEYLSTLGDGKVTKSHAERVLMAAGVPRWQVRSDLGVLPAPRQRKRGRPSQ